MHRNLALSAALIAITSLPAQAVETRTLTGSADAANLTLVSLDAGVGDIEVIGTEGDIVSWEVVLKPRRGGIFSSSRRGEQEVREARLDADVRRGELRLEIDSPSGDQRFEERWTIHMPARLAFELDFGVGDVRIRDLAGGINLDAGVGDVTLQVAGGRVKVEVGVGDIDVRAPTGAYGSAEASAGVGDATVTVRGHSTDRGGFIGGSASWHGDGRDDISVEVGVGDASVVLD